MQYYSSVVIRDCDLQKPFSSKINIKFKDKFMQKLMNIVIPRSVKTNCSKELNIM